MSGFKSYTKKEVIAALADGKPVYALDTHNYGEDDHLIGSESECLSLVLDCHELAELPADWTLDLVTWDIDPD